MGGDCGTLVVLKDWRAWGARIWILIREEVVEIHRSTSEHFRSS